MVSRTLCLSLACSLASGAFVEPGAWLHRTAVSTSRCTSPAAMAKAKGGKKVAPKKTGGGFGSAAAGSSEPSPADLLRRSMAMYDELERSAAKSDDEERVEIAKGEGSSADDDAPGVDSLTKFAVTLRVTGSSSFSDWVPCAIIAIKCGADASPAPLVPGAIAVCCKEVIEAGSQGYPELRKLPREACETRIPSRPPCRRCRHCRST